MIEEYLSETELQKWRESNYLKEELDEEGFQEVVRLANKVKKAPKTFDVEIWNWDIKCYSCHKQTPVVFPVGDFYGCSIGYDSLINLPIMLGQKYPFYKMTMKKIQNVEAYGNTCVHCNAYQGDWFVMEDYLEVAYDQESLNEKTIISVPLTDYERVYFAEVEI